MKNELKEEKSALLTKEGEILKENLAIKTLDSVAMRTKGYSKTEIW